MKIAYAIFIWGGYDEGVSCAFQSYQFFVTKTSFDASFWDWAASSYLGVGGCNNTNVSIPPL